MWWPEHNQLICPCRYRSPGFHVQSWYDEVKDYTYPYPHECNPWCPERCSGAMCTHYTQVTLREGLASAHHPPSLTGPCRIVAHSENCHCHHLNFFLQFDAIQRVASGLMGSQVEPQDRAREASMALLHAGAFPCVWFVFQFLVWFILDLQWVGGNLALHPFTTDPLTSTR